MSPRSHAVAHGFGKLFIVGEHAVVTPGEPAVLVGVDRGVTARVSVAAEQGSIHSPATIPRIAWRHDDGVPAIDGEHPYSHALAALRIVERVRAERGLAARHYDVVFESELDSEIDGDGSAEPESPRRVRKLGLGSSAAVTVAAVRAVGQLYDLGLGDREVYRLAMLATIAVSPAASGGDLAAATYGGWIAYRSPDRETLAAALPTTSVAALIEHDDAWAGSDITPLPAPHGLRLLVGWTGAPASTDALVSRVAAERAADVDAARAAFVARSRALTADVTTGLHVGGDDLILSAIRESRRALADLGAATGVEIETPLLRALCDGAEAQGAAAKPSGAGGGDCGIALAGPGVDVEAVYEAWRRAGVVPLHLSVVTGSRATASLAEPVTGPVAVTREAADA